MTRTEIPTELLEAKQQFNAAVAKAHKKYARLKSSLGYCSQGACLKIAVKGRKVCLHHLTYMREYKATRRAS